MADDDNDAEEAGTGSVPRTRMPFVLSPPTEADGGSPATGDVVHAFFDLSAWTDDERARAEANLGTQHVSRAWDGKVLVTLESAADDVELLLDEIRLPDSNLDPDQPAISYDLDDWPDPNVAELEDLLDDAGVAFDWDAAGQLVVNEDDGDTVDAIIDRIDFPDEIAPMGDDPEGERAHAAMSTLFVAADKLMGNARDPEGVKDLISSQKIVASCRPPYGIDEATWDNVASAAQAVLHYVEQNALPEDIEERALALRNLLRQYV